MMHIQYWHNTPKVSHSVLALFLSDRHPFIWTRRYHPARRD